MSDALREKILSKALISGFKISTGYGQVAPQLMPVSDDDTLIRFAKEIQAETARDCAEIINKHDCNWDTCEQECLPYLETVIKQKYNLEG